MKEPLREGFAVIDETGLRLLKAAQIIRERGWCQGVACDDDRRVCLLGAIGSVAMPTRFASFAHNSAGHRAAQLMASRGYNAHWNDQPGRTKEQVIDALEAVAWSRP